MGILLDWPGLTIHSPYVCVLRSIPSSQGQEVHTMHIVHTMHTIHSFIPIMEFTTTNSAYSTYHSYTLIVHIHFKQFIQSMYIHKYTNLVPLARWSGLGSNAFSFHIKSTKVWVQVFATHLNPSNLWLWYQLVTPGFPTNPITCV